MASPYAKISDYAEELISVPRAHLRLDLRQEEGGLSLFYEDRPLVECSMTPDGMLAAGFMAKALGTRVPPLGQSVAVRVSTGVLYRAIAIADLDFQKEESLLLLERLLEEAELQRGGVSEI